MHHASVRLVAERPRGELSALYGAFSAGLPSPLPELAVQLADFAVWQRQWLSGAALDDHLTTGRTGPRRSTRARSAADRPRPAVESHRGAPTRPRPAGARGGAVALSRREGVTLFMTLLAAFQVLLHRYTGQDDSSWARPSQGAPRSRWRG